MALVLFGALHMLRPWPKHPSIEKCFELIEESVEALEGDDLSLDAALEQI